MGVSMESVNQGLLDLNKIISSGMDAWDRVTQSTSSKTATPPIAQTTTTPNVTPGSQTTQQAAGWSLSLGSGGLIVLGLIGAALWWRGRS